jgi:hypothetical protein
VRRGGTTLTKILASRSLQLELFPFIFSLMESFASMVIFFHPTSYLNCYHDVHSFASRRRGWTWCSIRQLGDSENLDWRKERKQYSRLKLNGNRECKIQVRQSVRGMIAEATARKSGSGSIATYLVHMWEICLAGYYQQPTPRETLLTMRGKVKSLIIRYGIPSAI